MAAGNSIRGVAFLLFALACGGAARADALVLRNGERIVGEITEEGDYLRVWTDTSPKGVLVPKADVMIRYPSARTMLDEIGGEAAGAEALLDPVAMTEPEKKAAGTAALARLERCLKKLGLVESLYPDFDEECRDMAAHVEGVRDRVLAKSGVIDPRDAGRPGVATEVVRIGGLPTPGKPVADGAVPEMFLNPPAGTDEKDIAEAAKVVDRRLSECGSDSVSVSVVERAGVPAVRFTSKTGLTRAVQERIRWLGFYRGSSLEGRFIRKLTARESAEFEIPDVSMLGKVAAPPGAKWFPLNADEVVLLSDTPVVAATALAHPVNELDPNHIFKMPEHLARSLRSAVKLPAGTWETQDFCLVMDGRAFRSSTTRLLFEADTEVVVDAGERVTPGAGPGAGMKRDPGRKAVKRGKDVWVWSGLSTEGWRPFRAALKFPLRLSLTPDE